MDNAIAIVMCTMTWCHVIGMSSSRMAEAFRLAPNGYKSLPAAFMCLDGSFYDNDQLYDCWHSAMSCFSQAVRLLTTVLRWIIGELRE